MTTQETTANETTDSTDSGSPPGTKKDGAKKPSGKKALRWALKKFGEAHVGLNSTAEGVTPKAWALKVYTQHLAERAEKAEKAAAKAAAAIAEASEPTNEATQALVAGAQRKRDRKREQASQNSDGANVVADLKKTSDDALRSALNAYIDGPVKKVMTAFVTLYASRKMEGDSPEAARALDACREAFDACGLVLLDVATSKKASNQVSSTSAAQPAAKKPAARKPAAKKAKPRAKKGASK